MAKSKRKKFHREKARLAGPKPIVGFDCGIAKSKGSCPRCDGDKHRACKRFETCGNVRERSPPGVNKKELARAAKREQKARCKRAVKTAAELRISVASVMFAESFNDLSYDTEAITALAAEAVGTLLGASDDEEDEGEEDEEDEEFGLGPDDPAGPSGDDGDRDGPGGGGTFGINPLLVEMGIF